MTIWINKTQDPLIINNFIMINTKRPQKMTFIRGYRTECRTWTEINWLGWADQADIYRFELLTFAVLRWRINKPRDKAFQSFQLCCLTKNALWYDNLEADSHHIFFSSFDTIIQCMYSEIGLSDLHMVNHIHTYLLVPRIKFSKWLLTYYRRGLVFSQLFLHNFF